jgi:hypothetical protein
MTYRNCGASWKTEHVFRNVQRILCGKTPDCGSLRGAIGKPFLCVGFYDVVNAIRR